MGRGEGVKGGGEGWVSEGGWGGVREWKRKERSVWKGREGKDRGTKEKVSRYGLKKVMRGNVGLGAV